MLLLFGTALLVVAAIGTVSSSVFLILSLIGTVRFRKQAAQQFTVSSPLTRDRLPAVSILKPLHGIEVQLEQNLESFFQQDYLGDWELLFAVDTSDDAALPVARRVCEKYPQILSRILITGEPEWLNPPAYSFSKMASSARYDLLVTSDSDVEVNRGYLSAVIPPLLDSANGMLTCLYRGVGSGGIWSDLDAVGMSVEMSAGVLVANLLEGIKFGLGPTIVVRRDALEAIGGYEAIGDSFSNDFAIGNLISANGLCVVLSAHVVSHIVPPMSFKQMWFRQLRWAAGTRYSRPKGHLGTVFVFAIPYGLLGLLAGFLMGRPDVGLVLFSITVMNRLIESVAIGWGVTRDRECLTRPWLFVLRDLLGFAVWVASYLSRNMRWRDGRFELIEGGRIRVRERVAVD